MNSQDADIKNGLQNNYFLIQNYTLYTEPEEVPKCNSHKQQGNCIPSTQPPDFYVCLCDSCYQGDNCEEIFDICDGINCNQGLCLASEDCTLFQCKCDENYTHALPRKILDLLIFFSFLMTK